MLDNIHRRVGWILRNNNLQRLDFTQQYSGKATVYAIKIGM